ncbi:hypothetical protein [Paenibacillus polymyxa]|nr:hypothetical protein [Paenibacillus polymyxa]MBG9765858.1 hypothetical protein [Paenibacillus polymyxa]UOD84542.1 hypothetical protein CUU60_04725 [Paenibacillus polymyxa ATCC 842]
MSMYSQVKLSLRMTENKVLKVNNEISKLPRCGHDDFITLNGDIINAKITLNYGLKTLIEFLKELEQQMMCDELTFVGYFSSEERNIERTNLYLYKNRFFLIKSESIDGYGYSDTQYKITDLHNSPIVYYQSDFEEEKDNMFFVGKFIEDSDIQ